MEFIGNRELLKYLVNNVRKPTSHFFNVFNKIINSNNLIHYIARKDSKFFHHW